MALTKQAKILTKPQLTRLLDLVQHSRYPERERVMILLSYKAGMRAKEIAYVTWSMATNADGEIGDVIALPNSISKGKHGGREIPIHSDLRAALEALKAQRGDRVRPDGRIIHSERADGYSPNGIAHWFATRYTQTGIEGASSHSGRRTFITSGARKISEAGGSLRDIQQLAGHASLHQTQSYIEGSSDAKRKLMDLI